MSMNDTIAVLRSLGSLSHRMTTPLPNRPYLALTLAALALACAPSAHAQISLATAVDLAIRHNPRVRGAEADVLKANAQVSEALDAYIPSISLGAGLGQAYGYSPNPPTLATVTAGSIIYSASQPFYLKSARQGYIAARLALEDVQEAVAQDAALAFIALDHDQQREKVIEQQAGFANTLVTIVQQRADAGQDTQIDLTQSKLTAAQLRLSLMKTQDDVEYDREHLARLIDLPPATLTIDNTFPAAPVETPANPATNGYANAGVAASFATAQARQNQARGQGRFRYIPEINLVAQYNRYATFTDSFAQLQKVYQANSGSSTQLRSDEGVFGVQITLPLLDKGRSSKAREAAADAARALSDAQSAQLDALDGQSRTRHNIDELRAQTDVATLDQQLAQQRLDALHVQLQSGSGEPNAPLMTPKDEQKARIGERDKYLNVIDADYQIHQAEIQLLRQTDDLVSWLKSSNPAQPTAAPTPQP
jgi:outer membrane protein TolC